MKNIDVLSFEKDIEDFYTIEVLKEFFNETNYSYHKKAFKKLIYGSINSLHPIRHVLLWHFLEEKKKQKKISEDPLKQFGSKPWKCINRFADHFDQYVIREGDFHYSYESKKFIGKFRCTCGMVYTKSFKKKENTNKITENIKILSYGHVWLKKLSELSEKGLNLREIAFEMNVEVQTVILRASRAKIPINSKVLVRENKESKVLYHRKKWLSLIKENPTKSINEIKLSNRTTYDYLQRKDNQWLMGINKPLRNLKAFNNKSKKNYIKLDTELKEVLEENLISLLLQNPPFRISVHALCKKK